MNGYWKLRPRIIAGFLGLLVWGGGWAEAGDRLRRRAPGVVPGAATAPAPTAYGAVPPGARSYAPNGYAPVPTAVGPVPTSFSPSPYPMLGTFYPSPWLMVRGNYPAGGGYSPLGLYGDASMDINGPLSSFRGYTAPVLTYGRGYDGRPVVLDGNSFSTPNRPEATPVVYPTQATYYYRIRETGDPPWWGTGMNWIDQN